ncbi:MAG TPA: hypothetical protein VF058_00335 [Actinomycetota bacterium]
MVLHGILAAFIGTGLMTISSTTEMQWAGREASVAPGLATAKLLRPFGVREVKGRALDLLATWTHWVYGTLWGLALWALVGPAGLPLWAAGIAFFFLVWGAEQIHLPVLGIAPWPWKWGLKANLTDMWHHIVYAAGATGAWALIDVAG